ncbi:putative glycosyltransferase [Salinisphaera dokdonensis CL-ES53]|uniref:Glycosyltransferase n=1 Tax=Salinisphaera dokdonensis CL-ES53 TaxID=1304272 RepID=A0ABV2B0H2_9GAMM
MTCDFQIAAIVATADRPQLLKRALHSITQQSRIPDRLIIVDDSSSERSREIVAALAAQNLWSRDPTELLSNRRTPCAAGAWNTALDHLVRRVGEHAEPSFQNIIVFFLDDDDCWLPCHVEKLSAELKVSELDWVSSAFYRVVAPGQHEVIFPPDELRSEDFLVGNPGIQQTTLAVRLSLLLEAGLFDEALPACTDRDLCIRMADMGPDARYKPCREVTAEHHASTEWVRLSTYGSPSRLKALDVFLAKYRPRMSPAQKYWFSQRAEALFGWSPREENSPSGLGDRTEDATEAAKDGGSKAYGALKLLVGIIVDPARFQNAEALLNDLLRASEEQGIETLDVLLLENGSGPSRRQWLEAGVERFTLDGLGVLIIDQEQLAADGVGRSPCKGDADGRLPISQARSALQSYLYAYGNQLGVDAVWVLDDDVRLERLVERDGQHVFEKLEVGPLLQWLRASRVDIAIGQYCGDAPLPFAATMRGQMVDLDASLRALAQTGADEAWERSERENSALRAGRGDAHYDLSRSETDRLETPFIIARERKDETCREVFRRLAESVPGILSGQQVFRPLLAGGQGDLKPGVQCGGNTLVFDLAALRDASNVSPTVLGRAARRSDMNWALIQRNFFLRKVNVAPFYVRQDRATETDSLFDVDKLVDDIIGYAFHTAFREQLPIGTAELNAFDVAQLVPLFDKYASERLAALRLSFWRVRGLLKTIRQALNQHWFTADEQRRKSSQKIQEFLARVEVEYEAASLSEVEARVGQVDAATMVRFVDELPSQLIAHQSRVDSLLAKRPSLSTRRVDLAREWVGRFLPEAGGVEILGCGAEAVVFTDRKRVFKVFDRSSGVSEGAQRNYLNSLIGQWTDAGALYSLEAFRVIRGRAVLVYPYEATNPYRGGHGPGLVALIKECREYGVVCWNLHPSNLRVRGDRLKLVDYGADIRPYEPAAFESMCERAWLTWRWWHRPDLKRIMRLARIGHAGPFMAGYRYFRQGVDLVCGMDGTSDPLVARGLTLKPAKTLDYGCGKGKEARAMTAVSSLVVAFDPATSIDRVACLSKGLEATTDRLTAMRKAPFDLVICRRVICVVDDDDELGELLRDLRSAVSADGRVLVSVCHPAYSPFTSNSESVPISRPSVDGEGVFCWQKRIHGTGRDRCDVYRPERVLRRALRLAGLNVIGRFEKPDIDLDRFEPIASQLVLELEPLLYLPPVSLMIKVCAMEAPTLQAQVKHLVRQLETPRAFAERVLVIDQRETGFARQYAAGNLVEVENSARTLRHEGWIDRVVKAPVDNAGAAAINEKWFGLSSTQSHAENGAQVAATLAGFSVIRTRYVLHADSDCLIGRQDRRHDFLHEMVSALRQNQAVTVAFNIAHRQSTPFTARSASGCWRVESRLGLIDLDMLRDLRPLPNEISNHGLALPWHRSLDARLSETTATSLRGGSAQTYYVHPTNALKADPEMWLEIMGQVERGIFPERQYDQVDCVGDIRAWKRPERFEEFVFVICGRDVAPSRFRRCLESVTDQSIERWGAVVIDDGSASATQREIEVLCHPYAERISLVLNKRRKGLLANLVTAVREMCGNPASIIVTLDADDALLGAGVLARLTEAYGAGADATVGTMLRTDKPAHYPAKLEEPRSNRGGNVWQHLRSFRKHLFDAVPDAMLKLDGAYVELANDWAYMLPIIERADRPVYIREPLYLYEPSGAGKGADRIQREQNIARLTNARAPSLAR